MDMFIPLTDPVAYCVVLRDCLLFGLIAGGVLSYWHRLVP